VARSLTDLAGLNVSAEDFLAAVLDAAGQPIWVVDSDGVIRFANPAALAALGYDRADELLGRRSHETIHYQYPDGTPYPATECPMLRPRTTGETVASELDWFFRRDGSMFPVSYVSVPLAMPQGRGAVVAFTDIEDRLRAERVLREHDAVLAAQQASLRRIGGLVTGGAASADIFAAIAREVAEVLRVTMVQIWSSEPDGTFTVRGAWSERPQPFRAGTNWALDDPAFAPFLRATQAGRPARVESLAELSGPVAQMVRDSGMRSAAAAPIVVDGAPWGFMGAATDREILPDRVEEHLAEFTELVATAISNTQARLDLAASRARIVAAADAERRRVVRDLHDGAQQRLVHTVITLKLAQQALEDVRGDGPALVTEALHHAEEATSELRELAHGILPSQLTHGGLRAGVHALASRMPVPVENEVSVDRLPPAVEATAYFVIAEALTNVAKHSGARRVTVTACVHDGILRIRVRDDGVGGARPDGAGLLGLADRLAVLDGRLAVESPAGGGTLVAAELPLRD
jgi:PAS domain S-box-containing protein